MNERFEIIDEGSQIRIISPDDGSISTIISGPHGTHIEDAVIGAIRQQAHDIAELEVFAEIGRQWNADSLLAKWFPLTAERVEQDAQELVRLRADLAAAVAERDAIRRRAQDLFECAMKTIPADWRPGYAWADDGVMNVLAEYVDELRQRAEQAEARLAAIDGAPTVAIAVHTHTDRGPYKYLSYSELNVPRDGVELIARPAND